MENFKHKISAITNFLLCVETLFCGNWFKNCLIIDLNFFTLTIIL